MHVRFTLVLLYAFVCNNYCYCDSVTEIEAHYPATIRKRRVVTANSVNMATATNGFFRPSGLLSAWTISAPPSIVEPEVGSFYVQVPKVFSCISKSAYGVSQTLTKFVKAFD